MKVIFIILFTGMALNMTTAQQPTVHYTLGMSRPSSHLFEVELSIEHLPGDIQEMDFLLPVWRPGRYLVLDFASGVQEFAAVDGNGHELPWSKVEKSLWRIVGKDAGTVHIRYKVYANEFNLRTRGLNDDHALSTGPRCLCTLNGFAAIPCVSRFIPTGAGM